MEVSLFLVIYQIEIIIGIRLDCGISGKIPNGELTMKGDLIV